MLVFSFTSLLVSILFHLTNYHILLIMLKKTRREVMKKKNFLAAIAAAIMVFSSITTTALADAPSNVNENLESSNESVAEEAVTYSELVEIIEKENSRDVTDTKYFTFSYNEEMGSAQITDYDSSGGNDVIIPNHVNYDGKDYVVTSIGFRAMQDKGILKLFIPDTIQDIQQDAFTKNRNLESVVFENAEAEISGSVKPLTLRRAIFYWDYNIDTIVLPKRLVALDQTTFSRCRVVNLYFTSTNAPTFTSDSGFPQYMAEFVNIFVPEGQASNYKDALSDVESLAKTNRMNQIFIIENIPLTNYAPVNGSFELRIPETYVFSRENKTWSEALSFNVFKDSKENNLLEEVIGGNGYTIDLVTREDNGKYIYYNSEFNKQIEVNLYVFG